MKVKQLMTSPVLTATPTTPLRQLAELMMRRRIVATPVLEDGVLVGIVGEADIYRAIAAASGVPMGGMAPLDAAIARPLVVGDVMRRGVLWVKATDSARLAAQLLMRHARTLPVLQGRRVVGMISRRDVISALNRGSDLDQDGSSAVRAVPPRHPARRQALSPI